MIIIYGENHNHEKQEAAARLWHRQHRGAADGCDPNPSASLEFCACGAKHASALQKEWRVTPLSPTAVHRRRFGSEHVFSAELITGQPEIIVVFIISKFLSEWC